MEQRRESKRGDRGYPAVFEGQDLQGKGMRSAGGLIEIVSEISPMGRQMGNTSHQTYLNVQNNNEFFAIDVWDNLDASRSCTPIRTWRPSLPTCSQASRR